MKFSKSRTSGGARTSRKTKLAVLASAAVLGVSMLGIESANAAKPKPKPTKSAKASVADARAQALSNLAATKKNLGASAPSGTSANKAPAVKKEASSAKNSSKKASSAKNSSKKASSAKNSSKKESSAKNSSKK